MDNIKRTKGECAMKLVRFSSEQPEIEKMLRINEDLEAFLRGEHSGREWEDAVRSILAFQDTDGSFRLVSSWHIPSDARVDFGYRPTYLCSAILMKAVLSGTGEREKILPALEKSLAVSCGRGFHGHGYGAQAGLEETVRTFREGGAERFLAEYPDLCPEFTRTYRIASGIPVFVYGTLLEGRRNHFLLEGSERIGEGELKGYVLYDLGSYPGAVRGGDSGILGELYAVTPDTLEQLDDLEGEGTLYQRRREPVVLQDGRRVEALVYAYLRGVDGKPVIPKWRQPYGKDLSGYVWYVSYGSNLLEERFLAYILGGEFPGARRVYKGCRDRSLPLASVRTVIPYRRYFARESGTWEGKGVAFLDPAVPGETLGRAWLITKEQFEDVNEQEGAWYSRQLGLAPIGGIPAVTFTERARSAETEPSTRYLEVIAQGTRETEALPEAEEIRPDPAER